MVSHRTAAEWWALLPPGQPLDLTVTRGRQPRVAAAIVTGPVISVPTM
jgi:hypothetical protein